MLLSWKDTYFLTVVPNLRIPWFDSQRKFVDEKWISILLQNLGKGHLNHHHLWVAADPNMNTLESILASTIEIIFHILLFERKQDARNTKSNICSNITLTTLICASRFNAFANRLPLYLCKLPYVKSNHKNLQFCLFICIATTVEKTNYVFWYCGHKFSE